MLGSMWAGDCRVVCKREYLTQKNATDSYFFCPSLAKCRENILVFCLFSLHAVSEASHRRVHRLGIALKLRPKRRLVGEAWSQCWYMYTCELFTCRPAGNEER